MDWSTTHLLRRSTIALYDMYNSTRHSTQSTSSFLHIWNTEVLKTKTLINTFANMGGAVCIVPDARASGSWKFFSSTCELN
jgi:hypothetical protein